MKEEWRDIIVSLHSSFIIYLNEQSRQEPLPNDCKCYNLFFSSFPAPVPLYFDLLTLK